MPDIPVVGQRVSLISLYPTAVLRCHCTEHLSVVITTGLNNIVVCGNCGYGYCIKTIRPDGRPDIGVIFPTPKGAVM